jgi:hypothetical protein
MSGLRRKLVATKDEGDIKKPKIAKTEVKDEDLPAVSVVAKYKIIHRFFTFYTPIPISANC